MCQPASPKPGEGGPKPASEEGGCAKTILSTLARRAYRRPVADADIKPLLAMYAEARLATDAGARVQGSFDSGIERAVQRLLVSPGFLFRVERDPANMQPNTPYRISDLELASDSRSSCGAAFRTRTAEVAANGRLKDASPGAAGDADDCRPAR